MASASTPCLRVAAQPAPACASPHGAGLLPLHQLLGTEVDAYTLQDKHRRQFSPADKISEQPAGAIGAWASRRSATLALQLA